MLIETKEQPYVIVNSNESMVTVQATLKAPGYEKFIALVIPQCHGDEVKMRKHLKLRAAEKLAKEANPLACIVCGTLELFATPIPGAK